jgi:protein disulfide-isomerase
VALQQALSSAKAGQRPVLVIFGANWCEDCRVPDQALVSPDNQVLYATKAGGLANARRMSEKGIYDFFENIVRTTTH